MMQQTHISVLVREVCEALMPASGKIIVDATLGMAGHAEILIEELKPKKFIGLDQDAQSLKLAKERLDVSSKKSKTEIILQNGNFRDIKVLLQKSKIEKVDGLLADLGWNSVQFEKLERGFSFLKDEPLDMRYDTTSDNPTAEEVVNTFSEEELADIFWKFGEERSSRKIAKQIVHSRKTHPIKTSLELASLIENLMNGRGRIHPATKVFQALRIFVNDELGALTDFLRDLPEVISKGGRVAIISFHSLEDRIIKNDFKDLHTKKIAKLINKHVIVPTRDEIITNPRSRSAKLRIVEFL